MVPPQHVQPPPRQLQRTDTDIFTCPGNYTHEHFECAKTYVSICNTSNKKDPLRQSTSPAERPTPRFPNNFRQCGKTQRILRYWFAMAVMRLTPLRIDVAKKVVRTVTMKHAVINGSWVTVCHTFDTPSSGFHQGTTKKYKETGH